MRLWNCVFNVTIGISKDISIRQYVLFGTCRLTGIERN